MAGMVFDVGPADPYYRERKIAQFGQQLGELGFMLLQERQKRRESERQRSDQLLGLYAQADPETPGGQRLAMELDRLGRGLEVGAIHDMKMSETGAQDALWGHAMAMAQPPPDGMGPVLPIEASLQRSFQNLPAGAARRVFNSSGAKVQEAVLTGGMKPYEPITPTEYERIRANLMDHYTPEEVAAFDAQHIGWEKEAAEIGSEAWAAETWIDEQQHPGTHSEAEIEIARDKLGKTLTPYQQQMIFRSDRDFQWDQLKFMIEGNRKAANEAATAGGAALDKDRARRSEKRDTYLRSIAKNAGMGDNFEQMFMMKSEELTPEQRKMLGVGQSASAESVGYQAMVRDLERDFPVPGAIQSLVEQAGPPGTLVGDRVREAVMKAYHAGEDSYDIRNDLDTFLATRKQAMLDKIRNPPRLPTSSPQGEESRAPSRASTREGTPTTTNTPSPTNTATTTNTPPPTNTATTTPTRIATGTATPTRTTTPTPFPTPYQRQSWQPNDWLDRSLPTSTPPVPPWLERQRAAYQRQYVNPWER